MAGVLRLAFGAGADQQPLRADFPPLPDGLPFDGFFMAISRNG